MIPLSDELPTVRTPWMTYAILAAMFLTPLYQVVPVEASDRGRRAL